MPLPSGLKLGTYEILSAVGAGGMGEVYRARDSKLKRDVALKVLPAHVSADPERLARFQREAEVLASLNHPHIAQIYGVEESSGTSALVMELVEGEDLAERIARGSLPLDEALPLARQIAAALEAAHDAGIVHRDLKPANIKVRPDGTVKVLDFGLAKESRPGHHTSADLARSPTITSPAMTIHGAILGTAAYMAPEQAKGKLVDKRADIWAFGCVLYEMLAGRRAFDGDDVTDTIVALMSKEPDWNALPAVPPPITRLLRRCLDKNTAEKIPLSWSPDGRVVLFDRFLQQNASDIWVLPLDGSAKPSPFIATRFSERWAQFSPSDGRWVAYTSDESGRREVYVTRFPGADGRWQISVAGGSFPRWSHDGRELFFYSGDNKMVAARLEARGNGLDAVSLTPLFEARAPEGLSRYFYDVAPDGRFLLGMVPASGGSTELTLLLNWMELLAPAHARR